ncbi:electron transfer flavoprotein subunit beta/FixA family protein [Labedella populi]|uniref:Electron transfer flavoprotein subunit beta/FixA family protein n=1 Tax=Labedella populi TaxID=2498850 RepID=A0A444QFK6_9MICO|nr:electron transfer flavoprotein subunit beta/FixA family protein [Labedella populi]RWZ68351.1 electron transfer flavoprotein subunit beta/FixA family protein [Labedella populi]
MRVLVLVKDVPADPASTPYRPDGRLDRAANRSVMSGVDGFAVTEAVRLADTGEVVAATMGPAAARTTLRDALLLGADRAVHVDDPALAGADALVTARVLAGLVRRVEPDLVLLGRESSDARMGVLPAMLAEMLGWPVLIGVDGLAVGAAEPLPVLRARRRTSRGAATVLTTLPAVAAIGEYANTPREVAVDDARRAFTASVEHVTAAELGLRLDELVPTMRVVDVTAVQPVARAAVRPADPVAAILEVLERAGARVQPAVGA